MGTVPRISVYGANDEDGLYRPTFEETVNRLGTQWCGCGARPGEGLMPLSTTCSYPSTNTNYVKGLTVPVLQGLGIGPHGFDTLYADAVPNVCSEYPLYYQVADRDVENDPMDEDHMWHPPTSGTTDGNDARDPHQRWGYIAP